MRLRLLFLVVVVLATVFACYEFCKRPARFDTNVKSGERPRESPLSQSVIDRVEKLVLFVGYMRSGHSIIGSVMDAHPNMVISHEYQLLPRCVFPKVRGPFPNNKRAIFNALYTNSHNEAMTGWRSQASTDKGYNLHVSTPWQGAFTHLRVIGDKGGKAVSDAFSRRYERARACLQNIMDIVKVPLIVFHVVRNPYDMIATEILRTTTNQHNMQAEDLTVAKPSDRDVKEYADRLFGQATAVTRIMELARVVEIHSEDFVAYPRETVRGICTTLNLTCPEEYVDACYEKAYRNSSQSRYNMEWSPNMLQYVGNNMRKYSFFSRYTFDL